MNSSLSAEIYSRQVDVLGESPLWSWSEQALYWLDIGSKKLHRRAPVDATLRSWFLPDYPGCLAELTTQTLAIAMGEGVHSLRLDSGAHDLLCAAPRGPSRMRFNDGKVDPSGRFWVGTMQNNFGPTGEPLDVTDADGALYRFDPDGSVHTIEEHIGIPNTLAWTADSRRFYFADSLRGQIYVYDFESETGAVRNKRVFLDAGQYGVPDGSAIDVDGCLWNARWNAGVILRITPPGKVDKVIALPVPRPTSCAFGGPRLETLYVTSASLGLTTKQLTDHPLSGCVFAVENVGQGVVVPQLAGKRSSGGQLPPSTTVL